MERKIMNKLVMWTNLEGGRMPLLLHGARQVGKTYVIRQLGEEFFKYTIYVNFEKDEQIGAYFNHNLSPEHLIEVLEKYYNIPVIPGETLIIFDEIQMCERALTSLKYFAEDAPEYHVIAAGSLLGVAINRKQYSFPVGKVIIENMYPMDFEEFLWAREKKLLADEIRTHFETDKVMVKSLHEEALFEYDNYLITGGMPAAVMSYISPKTLLNNEEVRQMILDAYIADMTKYAENNESVKIYGAYKSLPMQLAKDNKKFQFKLIKSGARASQYGDAIDWLIRSGIVCQCNKCEQGAFPLAMYQDLSSFKLYYSDCGLLAAHINISQYQLDEERNGHTRGICAENYVACTLKSNGYDLNYWESGGKAEVDFLIQKEGKIIPIECKASDHVRSKSLSIYNEKFAPEYSIRISSRNFGFTDGIKSVPLYAVHCILENTQKTL